MTQRRLRGQAHPNAKLTQEQVNAIRAATGMSQAALAKAHNVSKATISLIRSGKLWPVSDNGHGSGPGPGPGVDQQAPGPVDHPRRPAWPDGPTTIDPKEYAEEYDG